MEFFYLRHLIQLNNMFLPFPVSVLSSWSNLWAQLAQDCLLAKRNIYQITLIRSMKNFMALCGTNDK